MNITGYDGVMQITVFGAGGKVGSRVVRLALAAGYDVVAFVHTAAPFLERKGVKIIRGDVNLPEDVRLALVGSDAVVSALASWHTEAKDIQSAGMLNIVTAMKTIGIKRIISVTGTDARFKGDQPKLANKVSRYILGIIANKVIVDGENHMKILDASGLDWTVLRSPVMVQSGPATYHLQLGITPPWLTIPYDAVAHALVNEVEDKYHFHQAPFITRG